LFFTSNRFSTLTIIEIKPSKDGILYSLSILFVENKLSNILRTWKTFIKRTNFKLSHN